MDELKKMNYIFGVLWFVWFVSLDELLDIGGIGLLVVVIDVLFGGLEVGLIMNWCWNFGFKCFVVVLGGWLILREWIGIIWIVLFLLSVMRVFCILVKLEGILFDIGLVLFVVLLLGWFGWVGLFVLFDVVLVWDVFLWFVCFRSCCIVKLVLLVGMLISFLCVSYFEGEGRRKIE